jgi:hypothetical protein
MKTKERWTKFPTKDGHLRRNDTFFQKKWFCDRQNAQEFAGEYHFGSLDGVLRRKSVHQFSPDASGRHNVSPRREPIPKRSLTFNGKSRSLVHPTMLQKAKGVAGFLAEMSEKAGPLNAMTYTISRGVGTRKKAGPPKMPGHPTMCMKIKGKKILIGSIRRCL